jgi:hypothetical protein
MVLTVYSPWECQHCHARRVRAVSESPDEEADPQDLALGVESACPACGQRERVPPTERHSGVRSVFFARSDSSKLPVSGPLAERLKVSKYERSETESLDDLRALMQGRVFHVSRLGSLRQILADGEIRHNRDRLLPTAFGYLSNGYFRNRGCVSVFDYRADATDVIAERRSRCCPFSPASPDSDGIAIFVLDPATHARLRPWTDWEDEKASSEMVVPRVEAGYPGAIPLALISEILTLEVIEDRGSVMAAFRRAREKRLGVSGDHKI